MNFKNWFRFLYKHSSLMQGLAGAIRRPGYRRTAQAEASPFNGDGLLTRTADFLLTQVGISAFVETGTYLGHTCRYIASRNPHLPVITVESNPDFYDASQTTLGKIANVKAIMGNSAEQIDQIVQRGLPNGLPLLFLDAHWDDFLPLPDEIRSIGMHLTDAIMIIHHFQVPGRDDCGFDICNGQVIGMEMFVSAMAQEKSYALYLPRYSYQDAYGIPPRENQQLRGYAIIFQGAKDAENRFANSECAAWFVKNVLQ